MREIQYQSFSLKTHKKNFSLKSPNVAQFELTFKCGLRCKHCYTDCYNKPAYLKKELSTQEIKLILDKAYQAGVIWVCFTGGDPLTRGDFLDIYAYAKQKGFIVTIFTNAYSMTKEIAGYFENKPPFVIEMTLNAATQDLYETISQIPGSFERVMRGIKLILEAKTPLKIKTQIIKDNLKELPKIRQFVEGLGLSFRPSIKLQARLNGDLAPCALRISPQEVLNLNGNSDLKTLRCVQSDKRVVERPIDTNLFPCAIGGGDGMHIDPYGNMFSCNAIRKPAFNLLKTEIAQAREKLLALTRNRKFLTNSKCKVCNLRESCQWCPGRAYLETGDLEAPIKYDCELTCLMQG